MALYLAARGLVGEWRGSLIRHGSVLETVNYYVHTWIFLRESCVIQTTVLVNSGDRRVYCPRRSRFWPPITTTLLTSSRLHSHLHPPLARPLSLSQISAMAPPVCPSADDEQLIQTHTHTHTHTHIYIYYEFHFLSVFVY